MDVSDWLKPFLINSMGRFQLGKEVNLDWYWV